MRKRGRSVLGCSHTADDANVVWDISGGEGPATNVIPRIIVHAAAKRAPIENDKRDEDLWNTNVGGTARVIEWGLQRRIERFVLISGAVVYGEWNSPRREDEEPNAAAAGYYPLSKWAAERIALAACNDNCGFAVLRLASLYGAEYRSGLIRHFLTMARADGRIRVDAPLDDAFDLLHLRDAASAVVNALELKESRVWNVGGGSLCSLMEIAETCAEATGAIVEQSRRRARRKARILNWVDDSRARSELGHGNTVTLTEGIRDMLDSEEG